MIRWRPKAFRLRYKLLAPAMILFTAACSPLTNPNSAPRKDFFGPVPAKSLTPADAALRCLANSPSVRGHSRVYAVHVINDQTQRFTTDDAGGFVPSDAAGMFVTALGRAGVRQVNRVNTAVSEFELNLAREQILGDGRTETIGGVPVTYRAIDQGEFRGSDFVIDGSITQLDFNTYSYGGEGSIFGIGGGKRKFALTVGADIRVTNTRTTELVSTASYVKQAVGSEVFGSVYRFANDELFDIKIGGKDQEGLHFGIRWLLSEAAYEIVSEMTGHDGSCDRLLPKNTQAIRASESARAVTLAQTQRRSARRQASPPLTQE